GSPRALHTLPTRRSSDLWGARRRRFRTFHLSLRSRTCQGEYSAYREKNRRSERTGEGCSGGGLRGGKTGGNPEEGTTSDSGFERDRKSTRLNSSHVKISY